MDTIKRATEDVIAIRPGREMVDPKKIIKGEDFDPINAPVDQMRGILAVDTEIQQAQEKKDFLAEVAKQVASTPTVPPNKLTDTLLMPKLTDENGIHTGHGVVVKLK